MHGGAANVQLAWHKFEMSWRGSGSSLLLSLNIALMLVKVEREVMEEGQWRKL